MIKNLNPSKIPEGTNHIHYWFVTALFTTVVIIQMSLVATTHLTAWKGGGFGMFAKKDSRYMRGLTVQAITEEGKAININPDIAIDLTLKDDFELFYIQPSKQMLEKMGKQLIHFIYVPTDPPHEMRYVTKLLKENKGNDLKIFKERISRAFYDPITEEEAKVLPYRKVKIKEITLQAWRMNYSSKENRAEINILIPTVNITK